MNLEVSSDRAPKKAAFTGLLTLVAIFVFVQGSYAPYLSGEVAFVIQYVVIFPGLVFSLVYFAYFKKIAGRTSFRISLAGTTPRDRLRILILAPIGVILGAWFVATVSLGIPILLAHWTPGTVSNQHYIVEKAVRRGGGAWSGRFVVILRDTDANRRWTMSVPRRLFETFPFESGELLTVAVKQGPFGRVPMQVCAANRQCVRVAE
jgi:hypothetical protein